MLAYRSVFLAIFAKTWDSMRRFRYFFGGEKFWTTENPNPHILDLRLWDALEKQSNKVVGALSKWLFLWLI